MRLFLNGLSNTIGEVVEPVYQTTDIIIDNTQFIAAAKGDYYVRINQVTDTIETSVNGGLTYINSSIQTWASDILHTIMFDDYSILFITQEEKMHYAPFDLSSFTQRLAKYPDGSTFNPNVNGLSYYASQDRQNTSVIPYDNFYIWVNYSNDTDISHIFYTRDNGQNIQIALKTRNPSGLFGLPPFPYEPRHWHTIEYNKFDDTWWIVTGDDPTPGNLLEGTHWHVATYDYESDVWAYTTIDFKDEFGASIQITRPSPLKNTTFWFTYSGGESWVHWGAETNGNTLEYEGFWKSKISTIEDTTTHEKVYDLNDIKVGRQIIDYTNGMGVGGNSGDGAPDRPLISIIKNYGETVSDIGIIDLSPYGDMNLRFCEPYRNANGYYRCDGEWRDDLPHTKTVWIRPGTDLDVNPNITVID